MICALVIMINLTKLPWTEIDVKNKIVAKHRCITKYDDSPCLKKFIKVGDQTYRAICGDIKR